MAADEPYDGKVWVNVQNIQLTENQGRWRVAIKTPVKTIDFDLTYNRPCTFSD